MEILEQSEGGATTVEGASKLLKRPMSACSHQSRKPTRKAMKPRRADPKAAPQTQTLFFPTPMRTSRCSHLPTCQLGKKG